MCIRLVQRARLVMLTHLQNERLTCFIHSEQLHLSAFTAELQDNTVQRMDRRQIPEVSIRHIDADLIQHLSKIECLRETARRDEEQLPTHRVDPFLRRGFKRRVDLQRLDTL